MPTADGAGDTTVSVAGAADRVAMGALVAAIGTGVPVICSAEKGALVDSGALVATTVVGVAAAVGRGVGVG